MLTEGFLAVLVILACAAGLGLGVAVAGGETLLGEEAWLTRYASWGAAKGLGAKVGAFVDGAANLLAAMGIPVRAGVALMGVLVASFAATTLDTACRLQRYVVQELASTAKRPAMAALAAPLRNKHGATIVAVVVAMVIAMWPMAGEPFAWKVAGKGGLLLWPMFGATNQLLGGLAFLVITFFLWRRRFAGGVHDSAHGVYAHHAVLGHGGATVHRNGRNGELDLPGKLAVGRHGRNHPAAGNLDGGGGGAAVPESERHPGGRGPSAGARSDLTASSF